MISSLALGGALIAALAALGWRRWHRARLKRAAALRPGSSEDRAIYVRSYDEMDEHLARRWCSCGGMLERTGEGTREVGERRFRIARLVCQECESVNEVFFETTDLLH